MARSSRSAAETHVRPLGTAGKDTVVTLGGVLGSRRHRRADGVLLGPRPGGVLPYPSATDRMENS